MPIFSPGIFEEYKILYVHSRTIFVRIRTEIISLKLVFRNGMIIQMSEKVRWHKAHFLTITRISEYLQDWCGPL